MKNRKQKAFLNMSSSLITQIVNIVCGLIAPRLILSAFGSTYNGVTASASQFLSVINLLTLGIAGATRVALYKPLANNDNLAVSRLMKASKRYIYKFGIVVIIYSVLLCVLFPLISESDLTWLQSASLVATVCIGSIANYVFGFNNTILLQASQRVYISNVVETIKLIINTISVVILIQLGCSIYIVKLGSSIIYFLAPLILSLYIKKKFSLTNKCEPDNTGIQNRKAVAFHAVANTIHDNTDLVILTFFVDAKLISVYTVYYMIVSRIKSLMRVFTTGMEAAFGDMWVKKEFNALSHNFKMFEYMMYTFTTIIFSCIGILIIPFVRVYTQGITDVNYILPTFAILITVTETVHCIRQPYLTLIYAVGHFNQTKWTSVWEAIINVCLSLLCVNFMGIIGVVIGTLAANMFCTARFMFYVSKHIIERSFFDIARRLLWIISCTFVIAILSNFIFNICKFDVSWIGWFIQAIVVFSIATITTLIMSLLFYRNECIDFLKTGLNVFKRK